MISKKRIIIGMILTVAITIGLFVYTDVARTTSTFLIIAFLTFFYKIDSRILIAGALGFLVMIMIFSFVEGLHITEYYAGYDMENLAVYTYFFLVIGVIAQMIEYKRSGKDKSETPVALFGAENYKKKIQEPVDKLEKFLEGFDENALRITMSLAVLLSVGSLLFFYFNNHWNLVYSDTYSHLNMARKIFDNITPGIGQLGGQWLPLLHILMAPFATVDFLWHSGLAGAMVSMPAFILSVYLIFKTIELFFSDKKSAFLGALVYMLNINILYLQTTAMMEPLFNLTIIGSTYFISKWAIRGGVFNLVVGSAFVAFSTLTRYEGYGVFVMAVLSMLLIAYFKKDKTTKKSMEGVFIIFMSVASAGILLWMVYLNVVFKDPLHWLHPLQELRMTSAEQDVSTSKDITTQEISNSNEDNPSKITGSILSATFLTNGAIVSAIALISLILLLMHSTQRIKISYHFVVLMLIPMSTFLFLLVANYMGRIHIRGPSIFDMAVFNRWSNYALESGMRYTLSSLPFVAFFTAIITVGSFKRKMLVLVLILSQFVFVFIGPLFLTYNFSIKWREVYGQDSKHIEYIKNNYTGGNILVSVLMHDDDMFKYGISYKNYIHEGAYKIWKESLMNPGKRVSWIIMNKDTQERAMGGSDIITRVFLAHPERLRNFQMVYEDEEVKIYKKK